MVTYKITRRSKDNSEEYYTNLVQAINKKEFMKKLLNCKDKDFYHIFGKYPGKKEWFKLE